MLLAALNLFFSELVKVAEDYGGTVEKNTGDGLMAYFDERWSTVGTPPTILFASVAHHETKA